MANAIQLGTALIEPRAAIEERRALHLVPRRTWSSPPESLVVVPARNHRAVRERYRESFESLEERLRRILIRNSQATTLGALRDRLGDLRACALAPALEFWLENGSPLAAYLAAVHNWCGDMLDVTPGSGALRWSKSKRVAAGRSAAYILRVLQPAFRCLHELCTNSKLRTSLWPSLPQPRFVRLSSRATPSWARAPRLEPEADGTALGAVWNCAEPLQAEVIALNWELSPELDD